MSCRGKIRARGDTLQASKALRLQLKDIFIGILYCLPLSPFGPELLYSKKGFKLATHYLTGNTTFHQALKLNNSKWFESLTVKPDLK